jgi:hypothetical protein
LQTTAERWDDFATVALEFTFQRCISPVPLETHLTFDVGPLFAATGGEIQLDGATLCASLAPSREARRKYLWARANAIDPLLLPCRPGRQSLALTVR